MPTPTILSIATTVPDHCHDQMALHDRWLFPLINSQRAKAIFEAALIDTRYSIFPDANFIKTLPSTKARNDLYIQKAYPLAQTAITQALTSANLSPHEIDHFIMVSCTGFDTPGLETHLARALGLPPTLRRTALIGMGCHAGLTALDRAMIEVQSRPQSNVLIVAVELCMIHFQPGAKLDDMIAGAIFADGVGAMVVGMASEGPQLRHTMSYNDYTAHDLMGVHLSDTGFHIRLSTKVSKLLRRIIAEVVQRFLAQLNLQPADIQFWAIHPGGAKIVEYIGLALQLSPTDLQYSYATLARYGNMSSATIFFVLDLIIKQGKPAHGDYVVAMTFGPGLTIELALLQF